jgi:hypothetical protein
MILNPNGLTCDDVPEAMGCDELNPKASHLFIYSYYNFFWQEQTIKRKPEASSSVTERLFSGKLPEL